MLTDNHTATADHDRDVTSIPETLAIQLAKLIKAHVSLVNRYEKHPIQAVHIEATERLAEQYIELLKAHPDPIIAQLTLYKTNIPWFFNFALNSCIYCCLLMLRNNINATSLQQILCGCITWTICARKKLEFQFDSVTKNSKNRHVDSIKQQTLHALEQWQRSVWLDTLNSVSTQFIVNPGSYVKKRNLWSPLHDYLKLSLYLAIFTTRNAKTVPLSFSAALKKLIQTVHCYGQPLLEPLLTYPGVILPGSTVITEKKETFLVLSRCDTGYCARQYDRLNKAYVNDVSILRPSEIAKVAAPGKLSNLKMIDKWWDQEWRILLEQGDYSSQQLICPRGYRIDKPPSSLVDIIEHLNEQDIEVAKLSTLIENEPGFAEHIRETATQQSRGNLRIGNVKHGLLMNGFERTKSVLVQKALVTRLNQHHFPLQDAIYQFVKLWAATASSIAQRHPKLLPEQASNWVYFCASGLFTSAEIKSCLFWQRDKHPSDTNEYPIAIKSSDSLWSHAHKLAVCWAQDRELVNALKDMQAKQHLPATAQRSLSHVLLSLSLRLACNMFFNREETKTQNDVYLQQYMDKLAIETQMLPQIMEIAVENSHIYWPIQSRIKIQNG